MRASRAPRLWASLALTAGVFLYVAPFALSSRVPYGQDLLRQFVPQAWTFRDEARGHRGLPLWNETFYAGAPRAGNLQEEFLSPPGLLHWIFSPPAVHEISVIAYIALAALGLYRLARSYRLGRFPSSTAALAYALSFPVTARLVSGHLTVLAAFAFAPLLLYRLRRTLSRPTVTNGVTLGWVGAGTVLGGQPQIVYQLALVAAGLAIAELRARHGTAGSTPRRLAVLAISLASAAAIGAVRWLPALEVAAFDASRTAGKFADFGDGVSMGHAFIPENFIGFFLPWLSPEGAYGALQRRDFWNEKAVYVGIFPLLAALMAAVLVRRPGIRFFSLAGLVALAAAMARDLPLHFAAARLLPIYGRFQLPGRAVWIVVLALCVLAAFGLDSWGTLSTKTRRRFLVVATISSCVLLGVLAGAFGLVRDSGMLLTLLAISAALLAGTARKPRLAAALAILFVIGDLCGHSAMLKKTVAPEFYSPKPWYLPHLGPSPGEYRVLDLTRFELVPTIHGVRLLRGYSYPYPRHTRALVSAACGPLAEGDPGEVWIRDAEALDELNVGWIVSSAGPPESGLVECARQGNAVLYRRPAARRRFFATFAPVEARRISGGWEAHVVSDRADSLVFSESWMPGWKADLNGRPAEIALHRGALMKVAVPPGTSVVRFAYRPTAFTVGLWTAAIALLATLGIAILRQVLVRNRS